MTPAEYRTFGESTYAAPEHIDREEYLRLLLIEELGEVASLFAKAMRDGVRTTCAKCGGHGYMRGVAVNIPCAHCDRGGVTTYGAEAVDRDRLKKELGDVMWCATMLTDTAFLRAWGDLDWHTDDICYVSLSDAIEGGIDDEFQPLWNAVVLCTFLGFDPHEVALANVEKLKDRRRRGVIHGAGDER